MITNNEGGAGINLTLEGMAQAHFFYTNGYTFPYYYIFRLCTFWVLLKFVKDVESHHTGCYIVMYTDAQQY